MKNTPNQYLVRISIFLVLILAIVIFVYPVLQSAFLSNIYINAIIIFSLIFGLFFNIYNLIQLQNDHSNLASFNIHKSPQSFLNKQGILKNIVHDLTELDGNFTFKSSKIDQVMENIDMSLSMTDISNLDENKILKDCIFEDMINKCLEIKNINK